MKIFSFVIMLTLIAFASHVKADPSPSWQKNFWMNIDISDLSRFCARRATQMAQNARDESLSPSVPQEVRESLQHLVIITRDMNRTRHLRTWRTWSYHTVLTYLHQGERYIIDGSIPHQVFRYETWLEDVTENNVDLFVVAVARNFQGAAMTMNSDGTMRPIGIVTLNHQVVAPTDPRHFIPSVIPSQTRAIPEQHRPLNRQFQCNSYMMCSVLLSLAVVLYSQLHFYQN